MSRELRDPRLPFSGGSDRWDRGPAGQIVTDEFFGPAPAPPAGGFVAFWSGSGWLSRPVLVRIGAAWVEKPAKRWTGTAWVLT